MEVLDHTEEHSPTYMRDVYQTLIGQDVVVYLSGSHTALGGHLKHYNGAIIHLTTTSGMNNIYIPADKIIAICSEK